MVKTAILSSAYFGPVQWFQKLFCYDRCIIERYDHFVKQTYRNRCVIAATQGPQSLVVPVSVPSADSLSQPTSKEESGKTINKGDEMGVFRQSRGKTLMRDILVSDHANWRHLHWNALCSAYGESPFFEFYADDLRPFFESRWKSLFQFNLDITLKLCELLDFEPHITLTNDYIISQSKVAESTGLLQEVSSVPQVLLPDGTLADDYREVIRPKHPLPDPTFTPAPYYQVYRQKYGFLPNLSILDLLFNEGNESILYLIHNS
ncbi:MAG: WbqC family protein [Prevotella sp.]|jgi:hypothetical protein